MSRQVEIIKPFEFILKINDNIICQRYFNVRNYNDDCRESLELKEMIDDIVGVSQTIKLGIIPEFLKYGCMDNSYNEYYGENNFTYDKDDNFIFEVFKNNIVKVRTKISDDSDNLLQSEVIASGGFNGNLFHPSTRYDINIKPIINDIVRIINNHMSLNKYTKVYSGVELKRFNILTQEELNLVN